MSCKEKCLFCKIRKKWHTNIAIQGGGLYEVVSVCPKCRELRTIKDIYEKIIEQKTKTFISTIEGVVY